MFINALTGPLSGGAQGSEKIQQGESANSRKGASFDAVMADTAETKTGEAAEPAVAAETTENEVAANTDELNENTAKDAAVSDDAPDEGVDTDAPDSVRLDVPRDQASDIAVVTGDLVADGGDEGIVSTENPQPVADHEGVILLSLRMGRSRHRRPRRLQMAALPKQERWRLLRPLHHCRVICVMRKCLRQP